MTANQNVSNFTTLIRKPLDIKPSEITGKDVYLRRCGFMLSALIFFLGLQTLPVAMDSKGNASIIAVVLIKFLFAFVVLALSLQGFTAVAMPFCQHQPAQHHVTMSEESHAAHEHGQAQAKFTCDDCASCQVCAAPAMPAVPLISLPEVAPSLITAAPISFSLFVPEQPQPPPLSRPV
jgi:hypothetical protein